MDKDKKKSAKKIVESKNKVIQKTSKKQVDGKVLVNKKVQDVKKKEKTDTASASTSTKDKDPLKNSKKVSTSVTSKKTVKGTSVSKKVKPDKVLNTQTNVTVQSPKHIQKVFDTKINDTDKPEPDVKTTIKRENTLILDTSEIKVLKNITYTIDLDHPEAEISLTNYPQDEYEYEDDFESYESDFESTCSSTTDDESRTKISTHEEERKLDSGNYDLRPKQIVSPPSTLSDINEDEGFVESINKSKVLYKRGKDILSKLKLDEMTFHLFEMQPMTYNDFMCVYGNQNYMQSSTQTKDDNLDMEVQTDDISVSDKCTQQPGLDVTTNSTTDVKALNSFIKKAGKIMLNYLEEQIEPKLKHNKEDLAFSEGHYKLKYDFDKSTANCLYFQDRLNLIAASFNNVNSGSVKDDDDNIRKQFQENYICIWHIQDARSPKYILSSKCYVNCCSFIDTFIIAAGCKDGSLLCWDLDDSINKFNEDLDRNVKLPSQIIISEDDSECGSITQIALMNSTEYDLNTQICVLHENGFISIWTLIRTKNNSTSLSKDAGLSLQSMTRLIESHVLKIKPLPHITDKISLSLSLEYEKMCLDSTDARLVYVFAKHANHIIACSVSWTDKFRYYYTDNDTPLNITSNPYKQQWFVSICIENVYVYKKQHPRPIIKISTSNNNVHLTMNQRECFSKCSPSYPGLVFCIKGTQMYVLDIIKQDVLCKSDFKERVYDVDVCRRMERDYLVISLKNRIEVHKISKQYRNDKAVQNELNNYIQLF